MPVHDPNQGAIPPLPAHSAPHASGPPDPTSPDFLPEATAAGTGVIGGSAAVLDHDQAHHGDLGEHHRPPRIRLRYQGEWDKRDKKVDLRHESHTTEMFGTDEHVRPTIGE